MALDDFLILGKGMATHARVPVSVLADVFESLVAAIYLDGGDAAVRVFIDKHVNPEIDLIDTGDVEREPQVAVAASGPARTWADANVSTARRKRAGPQQVLQNLGPSRPAPLSASLGPKQKRSRAARRPQCPERNLRRDDSVSVGLTARPDRHASCGERCP